MQDIQKEKQIIERSARLHWFHWMVVVASLLLTLGAWYISKKSIEEKIALQFDRQARQVVELVVERMQKYEDGLWAGVAALQAMGGDVDYLEWQSFAANLQIDLKYPGINGIGVIHYVARDGLPAYLAEQRELRADYRVFPEHGREDLWPITYIEPVAANAQAVGLDMAHESNRYQAALRARDSGMAQMTAPITLVQDAAQTPGFLMFAPFYAPGSHATIAERQAAVRGLVYAPFVARKLMEGVLLREKRLVDIRIQDGDQVLYDEHHSAVPGHDPNPLFSKQFEVDLYGRHWLFDIRSAESFRQIAANNQPMLILIGGIIIDSLLLTLFILLAHSNSRAYHLIRRMSGD